jgi:hypothetical protein
MGAVKELPDFAAKVSQSHVMQPEMTDVGEQK